MRTLMPLLLTLVLFSYSFSCSCSESSEEQLVTKFDNFGLFELVNIEHSSLRSQTRTVFHFKLVKSIIGNSKSEILVYDMSDGLSCMRSYDKDEIIQNKEYLIYTIDSTEQLFSSCFNQFYPYQNDNLDSLQNHITELRTRVKEKIESGECTFTEPLTKDFYLEEEKRCLPVWERLNKAFYCEQSLNGIDQKKCRTKFIYLFNTELYHCDNPFTDEEFSQNRKNAIKRDSLEFVMERNKLCK